MGFFDVFTGGKDRASSPTPVINPDVKRRIQDAENYLNKAPGPQLMDSEKLPQRTARFNGALPEYDAMRRRAVQQAGAGEQQSLDAMRRRFASLGNLSSGASIRNEQLVRNDAEQRKEQALEGVEAQEAQERSRINQGIEQRDFEAEQAARQRNFGRESHNADAVFQDKVFKFDSKSKLAQLEIGAQQAAQDAADNDFNKQMANIQLKRSGGLLGAGGFLGSGIG